MTFEIRVRPDGRWIDYLPRKVWYALFKQGLLLHEGKDWRVDPTKFDKVENLVVVGEDEPVQVRSGPSKTELLEMIKQGCEAAQRAAETKLTELRAAGPKYAVHESTPEVSAGGQLTWKNGPAIGTMLDLCGGARISGIKKNTAFGKLFAELSDMGKPRPGEGPFINRSERWSHAGVTLYWGGPDWASVNPSISGPEAQCVSIDEAANRAFADTINAKLGLKLYVMTYID